MHVAQSGDRVALQGNLDPSCLYASPARIREQVARVLASYGHGHGHVFNLGHGIHPTIPPEHAGAMIAAVHELSPRTTPEAQADPGSSSRSARRRILPTFVFGSSFLKYTCRGTL